MSKADAWEGGGKQPDAGSSEHYPEQTRRDDLAERHTSVDDADFYEGRLVPGGDRPARTPGGTGPSTRDTRHAVAEDANEEAMKRVELGGDLRTPYRQGDA